MRRKTSSWVCGSVYIIYIVLDCAIMCEFFNSCGTLSVSQQRILLSFSTHRLRFQGRPWRRHAAQPFQRNPGWSRDSTEAYVFRKPFQYTHICNTCLYGAICSIIFFLPQLSCFYNLGKPNCNSHWNLNNCPAIIKRFQVFIPHVFQHPLGLNWIIVSFHQVSFSGWCQIYM